MPAKSEEDVEKGWILFEASYLYVIASLYHIFDGCLHVLGSINIKGPHPGYHILSLIKYELHKNIHRHSCKLLRKYFKSSPNYPVKSMLPPFTKR